MHKHPKDHPFLCIYKMIFIAFLLSNLEGCATGVLHTALDNPTSLPFKELQFLNDKKEVGVADMQKELVGEYEGDIIFKDTKYSRFIIRGVRGNCDEKLPVELLLPGNKKSDLKPILRDLTVKKMSPEQTARIVLFHKNIKMDMVDHFLPSNIWREYSTVLVIGPSWYDSDKVVVAYRNGPGDGDVMFEEADTSGLSWICRRKAAYITKILLMPFTVAFDILTSPIQFIIFCAFYKP